MVIFLRVFTLGALYSFLIISLFFRGAGGDLLVFGSWEGPKRPTVWVSRLLSVLSQAQSNINQKLVEIWRNIYLTISMSSCWLSELQIVVLSYKCHNLVNRAQWMIVMNLTNFKRNFTLIFKLIWFLYPSESLEMISSGWLYNVWSVSYMSLNMSILLWICELDMVKYQQYHH